MLSELLYDILQNIITILAQYLIQVHKRWSWTSDLPSCVESQSQYGVTQTSHSHIYTWIEMYKRIQNKLSRGNDSRPTTGASRLRQKDPYNDPGIDAILLKSRTGDPELSSCSFEIDNDNSEGINTKAIDFFLASIT